MKSGGFWAVRAGLDRSENNPNKHLARLDMRCIFAKVANRRWREEHPHEYDKNNPPSKVWQDELYDDRGLPK